MKNLETPVVLIDLRGGLGNQLFHFAAGSVLSQKLGGKLIVNFKNVISIHDRVGIIELLPREVKKINIHNSLLIKLKKKILNHEHSSKFEKNFKKYCHSYVESNYEKYPSNVLKLTSSNVYLNGYFQSYFIVDEFKKNNLINFHSKIPEIVDLIHKIKVESPVVFHVRRGDYLNLSRTFGLLNTRYYENAYETCRDSSGDKIMIFTDSELIVSHEFNSSKLRDRIEIVRTNVKIPTWHYMVAMSFADKIVNSNSTFSWWASAISSAQNIVAPSYYYRKRSVGENKNLERVYPHWQLIEPMWSSLYDHLELG